MKVKYIGTSNVLTKDNKSFLLNGDIIEIDHIISCFEHYKMWNFKNGYGISRSEITRYKSHLPVAIYYNKTLILYKDEYQIV